MDLLLKNAYLVTVDPKRRIILDGAIAIDQDKIVDVGKTHVLEGRVKPQEIIDCKGKMVLPGLINTHVHLAQAMIRGCADDCSLLTWLKDYVWVLQGNYSKKDGATSARLCILEMIKSGTTSFLEVMIAGRYGFNEIAKVVTESGIRGALGKIVMDLPGYAASKDIMYMGMVEDKDTTVKETLAMHRKWQGKADGRIQVWFGARTPGSASSELYREVRELANKHKIRITFHLGEVREDVSYTQTHFKKLPVEYAESVGMLGEDVVLGHGIWFTEKELDLLAKTGTHISHNPGSNMKLASGIAKIPEMIQRGINVGLGTDGGPSNNTYDMIREMRLAAYINKVRLLNPITIPAETAIEMATINGARALGSDNLIGSIEIGKKADLIVLDMNKPHLTPSFNPVSNLVYAANGSDVDTVIIDGKIIMENRILKTIDEEKVLHQAEKQGWEVVKRSKREIKPKWPIV